MTTYMERNKKSELLCYTFGCLFFYKLEKNCVYTLREYVWCHGCVRVEKNQQNIETIRATVILMNVGKIFLFPEQMSNVFLQSRVMNDR